MFDVDARAISPARYFRYWRHAFDYATLDMLSTLIHADIQVTCWRAADAACRRRFIYACRYDC